MCSSHVCYRMQHIQKYSKAHGPLTAKDLCLKMISVLFNTTSVSLSHKTPKSQRSLNFDTGLNKVCGVNMLTMRLLY